jgi:hypothetical protein
MEIEKTLESGVDKLKGLAGSSSGKWILFGLGGLGLYLFLNAKKKGSSGSGVASGVGATYGLAGGGSSPVTTTNGGTVGTSGAVSGPSLDEQLAYQEKLGTLQIKLQGLINSQSIADQKQLLQVQTDQAAAQAAAALKATQDQLSYWFSPVAKAEQGYLTTIDTTGKILAQTPKTLNTITSPWELLTAAQQKQNNANLSYQQNQADIVTNQQKQLIQYQQQQITHTNSQNNQQGLLNGLVGLAGSLFGRSTSVPSSASGSGRTPPITVPPLNTAPSSPSGMPYGSFQVA